MGVQVRQNSSETGVLHGMRSRFDRLEGNPGPTDPPITFPVVVQKWEESERGWGTRPDGYSIFLSETAHRAYMQAFSDKQQADYARTKTVPEEYTRPDGEAYLADVDEETYNKLKASPNGVLSFNSNNYPGSGGKSGWMPARK